MSGPGGASPPADPWAARPTTPRARACLDHLLNISVIADLGPSSSSCARCCSRIDRLARSGIALSSIGGRGDRCGSGDPRSRPPQSGKAERGAARAAIGREDSRSRHATVARSATRTHTALHAETRGREHHRERLIPIERGGGGRRRSAEDARHRITSTASWPAHETQHHRQHRPSPPPPPPPTGECGGANGAVPLGLAGRSVQIRASPRELVGSGWRAPEQRSVVTALERCRVEAGR